MRKTNFVLMLLAAAVLCLPFSISAQQPGGGMNGSPAPQSEISTGAVAAKLNKLSESLTVSGNSQEDTAVFVLRCLFSCFAEDCGAVPKGAFEKILKETKAAPEKCRPALTSLWRGMKNSGGGWLFEAPESLSLSSEQIGLLIDATNADWSRLDTTLFGSVMEGALAPTERKQLGTHYTPAEYVKRLVVPTVIEPLHEEWNAIDKKDAAAVRRFHERLCNTVVLDPACGSGNFLGIAFELLDGLDAEVLSSLRSLGQPEPDHAISIQQFRGIEITPHAADVCELALRVCWLRSYCRTHNAPPSSVDNRRVVECRDALLASPSDLRPSEWPTCEFIVGNPPFVGSSKKRQTLGAAYVDALRKAYEDIPGNCDLVMYWWTKAAELLRDGNIHRFGFITTSSIRSKNNAKLVDGFLRGNPPISFVYAIPDHPWEAGTARVRIAMTVCEKGDKPGTLATISGSGISFLKTETGKITSRLSTGADVAQAKPLKANAGLCTRGVMLCNPGFIVSASQAKDLGLGTVPGIGDVIRDYVNGRDINLRTRDVFVIDLSTFRTEEEVKQKFPQIYAYLLKSVKPNVAPSQNLWWQFGNKKDDLREALSKHNRYIATVETAKNHPFVFLDKNVVPDNKLVVVGSDRAWLLGVLSSKIHDAWIDAMGSRLGGAPVYAKTAVFDTFPFPVLTPEKAKRIGEIAEKLEAFRTQRLKEHSDLTLAAMYSVLDKLRDGTQLTPKEKSISVEADTETLMKIHGDLDVAVFDAYGWPKNLTPEEVVEKVLALNLQRVAEEGKIQVQSVPKL